MKDKAFTIEGNFFLKDHHFARRDNINIKSAENIDNCGYSCIRVHRLYK